MELNNLNASGVICGIKDMRNAYKPDKKWMLKEANTHVNYNNPAHRCAYLHKHAMIHTGLMYEILELASHYPSVNKLLTKKSLKVCSLGGGPGSEIVALILLLWEMAEFVKCNVSIIDASVEWRQVFESVIWELKTSNYEASEMFDGYFKYQYLEADLLSPLTPRAEKAISGADIIFTVKFISATASSKTELMIQRILSTMKQNSILIFVDNAAGGFRQLLSREATRSGLESILNDPAMWHYKYENPQFHNLLFGYHSQYEATVAVEIWKKPTVHQKMTKNSNHVVKSVEPSVNKVTKQKKYSNDIKNAEVSQDNKRKVEDHEVAKCKKINNAHRKNNSVLKEIQVVPSSNIYLSKKESEGNKKFGEGTSTISSKTIHTQVLNENYIRNYPSIHSNNTESEFRKPNSEVLGASKNLLNQHNASTSNGPGSMKYESIKNNSAKCAVNSPTVYLNKNQAEVSKNFDIRKPNTGYKVTDTRIPIEENRIRRETSASLRKELDVKKKSGCGCCVIL